MANSGDLILWDGDAATARSGAPTPLTAPARGSPSSRAPRHRAALRLHASPATAPGRSRGASSPPPCRRTTSPCSNCAAPARSRSSCSSSWSIPAAPTSGGGGGPASSRGNAPARLVLRRASLDVRLGSRSAAASRSSIGARRAGAAPAIAAPAGTLWIDDAAHRAARSRRDPAARRRGARLERRRRARRGVRARSRPGQQSGARPRAMRMPWLELDLGRSCEWGGVVVDFAAGAARLPAARLRRRRALDAAGRDPASRRAPRAGCGRPTARGAWRGSSSRPARRREVVHAEVVPLELAVSPARYVTAAARARAARPLPAPPARRAGVLGGGRRRRRRAQGPAQRGRRARGRRRSRSRSSRSCGRTDGSSTWADVDDAASRSPTIICRSRPSSGRPATCACASPPSPPAPPGASTLVARYAVENRRRAARRCACSSRCGPSRSIRPGRASTWSAASRRSRALECGGDAVRVNARAPGRRDRPRPTRVGAARSEDGLAALAAGRVPARARVDDPIGFAEAAFAFDLALDAGDDRDRRRRRAAARRDAAAARPALDRAAAAAWVDARLADTLGLLARAPGARADRAAARRRAASPTACAPRSPGSSSTARGRASSPARAATGARGSATAPSPARRWPRWASPTRRAPSCAGTRPSSSPTAACRAPSIATASIRPSSTTATASSSGASSRCSA